MTHTDKEEIDITVKNIAQLVAIVSSDCKSWNNKVVRAVNSFDQLNGEIADLSIQRDALLEDCRFALSTFERNENKNAVEISKLRNAIAQAGGVK